MGTYSDDRQPPLERLLLEPARRWPAGAFRGGRAAVSGGDPLAGERGAHRAPGARRAPRLLQPAALHPECHARRHGGGRLFAQRPPVRGRGLRHADHQRHLGGAGTFFKLGEEILTARTSGEVLQYLRDIPEPERRALGARARARVMREHTAAHRAEELEGHALRLLASRAAA